MSLEFSRRSFLKYSAAAAVMVSCSGLLIDSVVPLTDEITNVNEENMRIYFSPSALDMQ